MNWILDEVKESIKNQITICENFMEICNTQMKNYESRYETNNIGEAVNHEYWRVCKIRTAYEIKDLKEILQEIDEITQEEDKILDEQIREFELAEEDLREKRENAKYGI